jgi:large subunit ribosomal protein L28
MKFQRFRVPTRDLGQDESPAVLKERTMAATCQVTGAIPGFGHNISHSHRRTKRRFDPNVQKKTYFVPSLRRNVTLTLSAKGIKVIDARGIESVVKDLLARGEKI